MNVKILVGILVGIVLICFTIGFLSLKHYGHDLSGIHGLDIGSKGITIDADGAHVRIGMGGIYVQDGKDSVKISPGGIDIHDSESKQSVKIGPGVYRGSFSEKNANKNISRRDVDEERVENIEGIESLYITTSFVDVNIFHYEKGDIKIHYHGHMKGSLIPKLEIQALGDTLYISADTDKPFSAFDPDLELDIYLPTDFKKSLEISTSSGDLEIHGIEISSLQINSSSGDIEILNSSIDSILVGSISGDQEIENLTCIQGNFDSKSGDIDFVLSKDSKLNLKATTSSGEIYSDFPLTDASAHITISTSSGDIDIKSK